MNYAEKFFLLSAAFFFAFTGVVTDNQQVQAQDPVFSQFYSAPLYMNPATAGTGRCSRIILNFRDQWPGINDQRFGKSHAYITYGASYDQYLDLVNGGVGVQIIGDQAGAQVLSTHGVTGMYAYRLNVNRNFTIQGGLSAALVQRRMDWDRLVFGDQLDPRQGQVKSSSLDHDGKNKSIMYPDFSSGIFAFSQQLYGGIAVKHLSQPNESLSQQGESKLPMRFTVHGGGIYYLRKGYQNSQYLSPDILYTQQGEFKQLNVGLFWSNEILFAGVWSRLNFGYNIPDALIPRIGFKKDFFRINYSYDFTISSFSNDVGQFNAGAHEIAVQFNFCPKVDQTQIHCPRFF